MGGPLVHGGIGDYFLALGHTNKIHCFSSPPASNFYGQAQNFILIVTSLIRSRDILVAIFSQFIFCSSSSLALFSSGLQLSRCEDAGVYQGCGTVFVEEGGGEGLANSCSP